MKRSIEVLAIASCWLCVGACSQGTSRSARREEPGAMDRSGGDGPGSARRAAAAGKAGALPVLFVLRDVQGLWGGRDLWIRGDGKAWVQFVGRAGKVPGNGRLRFELTVPPARLRALQKEVEAQRFFAITTRKRYGVPDEALPLIYVRLGNREAAKTKWANDPHPRFDALYQALLRIARTGRSGRKLAVMPTPGDWSPAGFPKYPRLRELAGDPTR
jgi:hypothetical protein